MKVRAAACHRNGDTMEALVYLKQAAGLDPNNIACLYELASLYNTESEPAKAVELFDMICQMQPDHAMSHYMTGVLSARLNQLDHAEAAFKRVIELTPNASEGYRELAGLYLKAGKNRPQARHLAQKAVGLQPSAANLYVLGWACHANGDGPNALSAAKRAVTMAPNNTNYQRIQQTD